MTDTTNAPTSADTAPEPQKTDDDQDPQPPDIVVSVPDLLDGEVGPLHDLDLKLIDEWTVAWAGVDQSGTLLSGKLARDFMVGPDGKSIVLNWKVVLDGAGS